MAEKYWIYVKHNVGFPSKGKYNVYNTGFYTDSITEIRKVAMDQALYDFNHQVHDGPHKIVLTDTGKIVEEVWFGMLPKSFEFIMKNQNGRYVLDEKTGRIKRSLKNLG